MGWPMALRTRRGKKRTGIVSFNTVMLESLFHEFSLKADYDDCRITVTFHDDKDGSTKTVQVPVGMSLLEAAHANDVDLEGTLDALV
jgi:hypothetical protein